MTKLSFILALSEELKDLPREEREQRLSFYEEMIEDRMEDGLDEEAAVASVGTVEDITAQILSELPHTPTGEGQKPKRRLGLWNIVLLILGAPVWLSLLIAAFSVVIALYAAIWSCLVCFWAVFASLSAVGFGGLLAGGVLASTGNGTSGLFCLAGGLVCGGIAIFAYFGCILATKGALWLTKQMALGIKKCFVRKEGA